MSNAIVIAAIMFLPGALATGPDVPGTLAEVIGVAGDTPGPGACAALATGPVRCPVWVSDEPPATDHNFVTAVSSDGSRALAGRASWSMATGHVTFLRLFDTSSGALVWAQTFALGETWPAAATFSPDGSSLYVAARAAWNVVENHTVWTQSARVLRAYDVASGALRWSVVDVRDCGVWVSGALPLAMAGTADGRHLVLAGGDGSSYESCRFAVVSYDAASGAEEWRYAGDPGTATALAQEPRGLQVYASGIAGAFEIGPSYDFSTVALSVADGSVRWSDRFDAGGTDVARGMAVAPDDQGLFVTGTTSSPVGDLGASVFYDAQAGSRRWSALWADALASAAFGAGGERAFAGGDGSIVLYDASTGLPVSALSLVAGGGGSGGLLPAPDGRVLANGQSSGASGLTALDGLTGAVLWSSKDHRFFSVQSFAVSARGGAVVASGFDRIPSVGASLPMGASVQLVRGSRQVETAAYLD
ncbi:MAG TPA: PQQ-binding-like beta-propeller repeat protein [Candidatus Thermoplasmatota archaeon]|nr:PQQ-binding-like beta-propeller repeat protein [Candidatus Thermoplasmatota archaeon]